MRRALGFVLLLLGAFALLLGIVAKPVIYDRLATIELDQTSQSISRGENMEALRVSGDGVEKLQGVTLVSTRDVIGIPGLAEGNSAFWQTTVESAVEDGPVLTYSEEGVSFDRRTAESTNCCGDFIAVGDVEAPDEPAVHEPVEHEGVFFKFPFDTQQQDYQYWDGPLRRAVPAVFQGEEVIEGTNAYVFRMTLGPETVATSEGLPGTLFGADEPVDADRVYENVRTVWVEPNTGVILKGLEEQNVRFEAHDDSLPTVPITVGTISYTDETVAANADEYGSKGALLGFINGPLTWIGILVGLVLLALGAFLALGRGRSPRIADEADDGYADDGYADDGYAEELAAEDRVGADRVQEDTREFLEGR